MKKICIFGGTFNPIHNGHINLVNKVIEHTDFDKIIVMPTKIPPHKSTENLASEKDRIEMCRLAFENNKKIEVSDYELTREGKSFTIYTLKHLKEVYPEAELYFIMGSDMFLSFETWYKYDEILKLATIISVSRKKDDNKKIVAYSEKIKEIGGECLIIPIEPYEVSSTEIRKLIINHKYFSCYLPKKVVEYIECNSIYN